MQRRFVPIFRHFDSDNTGRMRCSQLQAALEQAGIGLTPKRFKKAASDLDEDGLSFSDFCTLVRKLMGWDKSKGRGGRNIRMYLVPDQVADFTKLFRERAGPEGLIAHTISSPPSSPSTR